MSTVFPSSSHPGGRASLGLTVAFGLCTLVGFTGTAHAESTLAECADGVDNDGDGYIDINDTGCVCTTSTDLFSSTTSYISNPSFEDYSSCPTTYSQLDRCDDWQQATGATSDYYACGLESTSGLTYWFGTFPSAADGSAFAGSIMQGSSYVEYVGGCTTDPLVAGTEYTFEMYVASPTGTFYGGDTSGEIQLFGIEDCSELPISGYSSLEGSYDLLDEVTVSINGGDPFQLITFTFTPSVDYAAVVFGPDAGMTIESGKSGNYVLFDDLTLNATTSFGDEISSSGSCATGYTLQGPEPTGVSYQWYLDGEAIPGATSSSYSVPGSGGNGDYTLRVDDGADCNLTSNEITIACDLDEDGYSVPDDCDDDDASINPAAVELCDGVDNDCDGDVDEASAADAPTWYADSDGDGYGDPDDSVVSCTAPSGYVADDSDCDDDQTGVNPGATEYCDGIDNDCDGDVDEDDAADASTWYADSDGDMYGDPSVSTAACDQPSGYVADDNDCDDSTTAANPGATEYCDAIDNDCDGIVDESDAADASTWYADSDGDGFGNPGSAAVACSQPSGYVADASDCDDGQSTTNPGATEYCDGHDDDCDGDVDEDDAADASTWYADGDGDGWGRTRTTTQACDQPSGYVADDGDCDDSDRAISPDATELCDGVDNDCDGDVDEDDASDASTWYADSDGDSFGDAGSSTQACSEPSGYTADDSDCDDDDAAVNPDATELCDGIDNDCDGDVDEDDAADVATWYADSDGDGFGDAAVTDIDCDRPSGYVPDDSDCDDSDSAVNPDATELCDGIDNDCDGDVDEDDADDARTWYADSDGDGYGDAADSVQSCSEPSGYVADATDCDDDESTTFPGADEYCDGEDDDCDGDVDEDSAVDASTWYADSDGDGFGDAASTTQACSEPSGYVADATDCDDSAADINPDAEEIWYDGVDGDCDGWSDYDADFDGYDSSDETEEGLDCDDEDPDINPDAEEIWYDGVDQDCDGGSDYDADGDGFDSASYGGDDCDDADELTYPGAPDDPYDGVITDCDDADEYDADGDGFDSVDYGGEDCDDANSEINPGMEEIWYDGVDDDCDGNDDDQDEDGFAVDDDCDDEDGAVNPDAEEIWYDGVDDDCDGNDDDQDLDGYPVDEDCDDTDPDAFPGAEGWDDECNPIVDDTADTDAGFDTGGYKFEGGGGCGGCSAVGAGSAAGLALLPLFLGLAGIRRRRD